MVTVQIYGTDKILDVLDAEITYIKTAGDLGELTNLNSSYSWSMKFPKTPNNTQILDGLGMVGSGSRKPYEKIYVNLLENGYPIVTKGILNIKDTGENYGAYIQDGIIDFIKDINTDTVGDALDLSELNHERSYPNILVSLDLSLPYAYLIADVNGKYLPNESSTTNLDSAYMSPYANIKYIFDKIFETYDWTYEMDSEIETSLSESWMSYPSEIVLDSSSKTELGEVSGLNELALFYKEGSRGSRILKSPLPLGSLDSVFIERTGFNNIDFEILQTGDYEIIHFSDAIVTLTDVYGNETLGSCSLGISVNGNTYTLGRRGVETINVINTIQISLNAGDIVSLVYTTQSYKDYSIEIIASNAYMNFGFVSTSGEVSFTKALIKLKITDFVKEIMTRESLTPFVNSENRHIRFLTLLERTSADSDNWTSKYIKRKRESYLYQDYAQSNLLKHKYDDDLSNYNDGNLPIDNENLAIEKTIYTSFTHSPVNELSVFKDNDEDYKVPRLNMFEVEVREDEATGDLIGKYKFLKDRFFYVKTNQSEKDIYIDGNLVSGYPIVNLNGVLFKDIVNLRYNTFISISSDAKVHEIDLALSLSDIHSLDLSKLKYFEQESAYYILNRLQYKTGKITTGTFLKVVPNQKLNAFSNAFSNAFNI